MKHDNEQLRIEQRKTATVVARAWGIGRLVEGAEFARVDYVGHLTAGGPAVCAIEIKNPTKAHPRQMVDLEKARAVLAWDVRHNLPAVIVWRWPTLRGGWEIRWTRPRLWEWNWLTREPLGFHMSMFQRADRIGTNDIDRVVWIPSETLRPLAVNPIANERE